MVRLADFVAESFKQVIEGVAAAQDYAREHDAFVNPVGLSLDDGHYIVNEDYPGSEFPIPQIIEFDVAITASEGTEAKGGIGIFAGPVGVGTQVKSADGNVTYSRMKFAVPVLFPKQEIDAATDDSDE